MLLGENWCWSLLGPKGFSTAGLDRIACLQHNLLPKSLRFTVFTNFLSCQYIEWVSERSILYGLSRNKWEQICHQLAVSNNTTATEKNKKIAQFNYVPRRNPVFVGTKISHPSIPLVLKLKRKLKIKQDFLHTHSSSSTPSWRSCGRGSSSKFLNFSTMEFKSCKVIRQCTEHQIKKTITNCWLLIRKLACKGWCSLWMQTYL